MRLFEQALGIIFLLTVIITTILIDQRAGALVLGSISFLFSLLGIAFRKEISLNLFGKNMVLRGTNFKIYCLVLMLLSSVIVFKALY